MVLEERNHEFEAEKPIRDVIHIMIHESGFFGRSRAGDIDLMSSAHVFKTTGLNEVIYRGLR